MSKANERVIIRVEHELTHWWSIRVKCKQVETEHRAYFKVNAIEQATQLARIIAAAGGKASVVIHGQDGKIKEERTYPRSSDPRRSKG